MEKKVKRQYNKQSVYIETDKPQGNILPGFALMQVPTGKHKGKILIELRQELYLYNLNCVRKRGSANGNNADENGNAS
jgi:hypothetical protein